MELDLVASMPPENSTNLSIDPNSHVDISSNDKSVVDSEAQLEVSQKSEPKVNITPDVQVVDFQKDVTQSNKAKKVIDGWRQSLGNLMQSNKANQANISNPSRALVKPVKKKNPDKDLIIISDESEGEAVEEIVCQPDQNDLPSITRNQIRQAKEQAISSYRCVQRDKIDKFCFICGQVTFTKSRFTMSNRLRSAYEAYFGMPPHTDEWWIPSKCCSGCARKLGYWYTPLKYESVNGKGGAMKFAVPMIWREPPAGDDHEQGCYFCLCNIECYNQTRRKFVKYPNVAHVTGTIPHSEQHPVPLSPNITSPQLKNSNLEINTPKEKEEAVPISTEPRFFKQEDLDELFRDLAPISLEKREIIISRLRDMNLLDVRRSERVRKSAGSTRKRYLDEFPEKIFGERIDGTVDADDGDEEFEERAEKRQKLRDPDFYERGLKPKQQEKIIIVSLNCIVESCPTVWSSKADLDNHLQQVHNVLKFRCFAMGCPSSFNSHKQLKAHISTSHPNPDVWQCGRCHRPKNHLNEEKPYLYSSQSELYYHIRCFHQIGHYRCGMEECNFEARNACRRTILKHQYDDPNSPHCTTRLPCPHPGCEMVFISASRLNQHLIKHQPDKFKNVQCEQCEKKFWSQCDMKRHMLVHAGVKPFQCEHCGKSFTLKGSLTKHMQSQHPNSIKN